MITWLAVQTFLKKAWAWCKKYWQFLVGAAVPIVIWVLTRDSKNLDKVVERIQEDHKKEVDAIDKSHQIEIEMREQAVKNHTERLIAIEEEHERSNVEISRKKKKRIKQIIQDHENNPEEITRRIAELTGINVHVK